MPKFGYSMKVGEPCARAYGKEMRVSPKDALAVCRTIRGMPLEKAKEYLEDVRKKRKVVPYSSHRKKLAHKRGMKGGGSYPVKAAGEILKVLKNAEENARYKGLDVDRLKIIHASACRGIRIRGIIPRAFGRATAFDKPLTNVQILLKEAP
jgi:large subunit ribosomal protein L22